jgi:amino-acid N-acetyltransferase
MPDAVAICDIVNYHAERGRMLHRSLESVYDTLRNFLVARIGRKVVGCVAVEIAWADLAEVKSLAVHPELIGRGIGKRLMRAAIRDARALGIRRLFALTYERAFFTRCGFGVISRDQLPSKVWSECIYCSKRNACDETAVLMELGRPRGATRRQRQAASSPADVE